MCPFLDYDESNIVEPHAVDADREWKLRCIGVDEGTDKNGHEYFLARLEIIDEIGAKDVTQFMHKPDDSWMDAKKLNSSKYAISQFIKAFNTTKNTDDWVGSEGWAILGVKQSDEYGPQNFIKRFVINAD